MRWAAVLMTLLSAWNPVLSVSCIAFNLGAKCLPVWWSAVAAKPIRLAEDVWDDTALRTTQAWRTSHCPSQFCSCCRGGCCFLAHYNMGWKGATFTYWSLIANVEYYIFSNVLLLNSAVRKLKLKLPPPLRYLATLPCENWSTSCTAFAHVSENNLLNV